MNKINNRQIAYTALAACAAFFTSHPPVFAEGHKPFSGAQGVNRVIRTQKAGYVKVGGTGSISCYLPKDTKITSAKIDKTSNPYGDKPSFYLGGEAGGVEIDAGIQYEWDTKRVQIPSGQMLKIHPGWSTVMKTKGNHNWTSPRIYQSAARPSVPWRGSNSPSPFTATLEFTFKPNGTVLIYISALPGNHLFYYNVNNTNPLPRVPSKDPRQADANHRVAPWLGDAVVSPNDLVTANVKRVVAMTRSKDGGYRLDDSNLSCTWSNCYVARRYPQTTGSNQETIYKTTAELPWRYDPQSKDPNISNMIDQDHTGYDAPDSGPTAYDHRKKDNKTFSGKRAYIVNFPHLNVSETEARRPSNISEHAKEAGSSRYTQETVEINLKRPLLTKKGR